MILLGLSVGGEDLLDLVSNFVLDISHGLVFARTAVQDPGRLNCLVTHCTSLTHCFGHSSCGSLGLGTMRRCLGVEKVVLRFIRQRCRLNVYRLEEHIRSPHVPYWDMPLERLAAPALGGVSSQRSAIRESELNCLLT